MSALFLFEETFSLFLKWKKIAHATIRKLTDVKGISDQKAAKLKETSYKIVPMGFSTV